ncbi:MAG: fibronectin type III domain-containing protein, partial [Chloroflexales bacterium]|nr:fibronectin type III domain-containing protein [Chloroflexales bacterium]
MPSGKTRQQRLIDVPTPQTGQATALTQAVETVGPIARPTAAPSGLTVVATRELRSAVTPTAAIDITWLPPVGTVVTVYLIQWATDSGFTTGLRQAETNARSATLEADTGTPYWIRVLARSGGGDSAWSNVVTTTTPQDTSPPAAPTGLNANWNGRTGDLLIAWTNPTSANLRDVRVRVYASNGGVLLTEAYSSVGRYTWTLAANLEATANNPDPDVYLELTSRSWSAVVSTTDLTGTATLAAPANVSGASVDFSGPDAVWTWNAVSGVAHYALTIDGETRRVDDNRYVYAFRQNQAEHGAVADPSLDWSLVAVDALGQVSATAASGTVINAPPATTTITLTAGFQTLAVSLGTVTDADFRHYRVRLYRDSVLQDTVQTTQTLFQYEVDAAGGWSADVTVVDVFGQLSAVTTSATVSVADFVTIERLRADVFYRDNHSRSNDLLGSILKNDDFGGSGMSYPINQWNWTAAERPATYRVRTIPIGVLNTGVSIYVGTSTDGSTWTWHYGGSASNGIWEPTSTTTTETTAQAGAVTILQGRTDILLSGFVEARFVRLGHRSTTSGYNITEFYPRRLVQTDDLEAESVTTLKLATGAVVTDKLDALAVTAAKIDAGAVTADKIDAGAVTTAKLDALAVTAEKIDVSQLEAISADMGNLTAGTITGATIRSATSGRRWEGDSAGLRTYNASNVLQIEIGSSSEAGLQFGQGRGSLNASGIALKGDTTGFESKSAYRILQPSTPDDLAIFFAYANTSGNWGFLRTLSRAGFP